MKLSYDLHLHSCLSPCGDNDMTPCNIVNMAILKGLSVIALTDHNSCKNCPAFVAAGRKFGILAIPGMELCTAEEIHVVCLFPDVESALAFDEEVYSSVPEMENDPSIFGDQLILDEEDQIIGTEPRLLVNASAIPVERVPPLAGKYGGFAFPAHIDRPSYSILSSLGQIPPECGFTLAEVRNPDAFFQVPGNAALAAGLGIVTDSDAHYLWDIAEPERFLSPETCSARSVLEALKKFHELS